MGGGNKIMELADRVRFTDLIPYPSQEAIFQQFGELIINECTRVVRRHRCEVDPETIIDEIRTHFKL